MNIPEGYLPRAQLIERGWTARLINDLIEAECIVKIDDVAEGVSPRCYLAPKPSGASTRYAIPKRQQRKEK